MNQELPDHYKTLGVTRTATPQEIKKAYRDLARLYHPDANPSPKAQARMQRLNEAIGVLENPAKRAAYDAMRTSPRGNSGGVIHQKPPNSDREYDFFRGPIEPIVAFSIGGIPPAPVVPVWGPGRTTASPERQRQVVISRLETSLYIASNIAEMIKILKELSTYNHRFSASSTQGSESQTAQDVIHAIQEARRQYFTNEAESNKCIAKIPKACQSLVERYLRQQKEAKEQLKQSDLSNNQILSALRDYNKHVDLIETKSHGIVNVADQIGVISVVTSYDNQYKPEVVHSKLPQITTWADLDLKVYNNIRAAWKSRAMGGQIPPVPDSIKGRYEAFIANPA